MKMIRNIVCLALSLVLAGVLAGCGASVPREPAVRADLSQYPASNMSGFASLTNYAGELRFHDVTVADAAAMMDAGESFILLCAYPGCPWCELLVGPLNDAAEKAGWDVAFLNTRSNPNWTSNLEIDDYDLFVERFGRWLEEDESGTPHLYVPDLYIVRNGELVANRPGVLAELDDPSTPMTDEQRSELSRQLDEFLAVLG